MNVIDNHLKRYILSIIFSLLQVLCIAQESNFALLRKELKSFANGDTVVVFGVICNHCNGFSQQIFYLSTVKETKMYIANYEINEAVKIYDTTFQCQECPAIVSYSKSNYKLISEQFSRAIDLLSNKVVKGHKTSVTPMSSRGWCYFLGLYSENNLNYTFFSKLTNINLCFNEGNQMWTIFSHLKNQWPNVELKEYTTK
jgi:hypothetical protein